MEVYFYNGCDGYDGGISYWREEGTEGRGGRKEGEEKGEKEEGKRIWKGETRVKTVAE